MFTSIREILPAKSLQPTSQNYVKSFELTDSTSRQRMRVPYIKIVVRLLVIGLSAAVVGLLGRSLCLYHSSQNYGYGTNSLDYEFEPTGNEAAWPSTINLIPTDVLLAVAAASTITSLCLTALAAWARSEVQHPSLGPCELVLSILYIVLWIAGTVIFEIAGSKNSLGHFSCSSRGSPFANIVSYDTICAHQVCFQNTRAIDPSY